ncbi:MAG TPA: BadF/BadG/BcrA/BcrD ATPase family protein [Rhodothermales bacterium]
MPTLFVGLDAGGTKTAVVAAVNDGDVSFEETIGGINLQRTSPEEAAAAFAAAVQDARSQFPEVTAICAAAGVAGGGRDDEARDLAERWRALLPADLPNATSVVHDGVIALEGAFRGESGAIVIAGTGSVVLVRSRNHTYARAGGWGYLIGDEGSGHALGAEGFRAVAAALDGGPETRLRSVLEERFAISSRDELIRAVYRARMPLQTLAPSVLELAAGGDAACISAVRRQVGALADQLAWAVGMEPDVDPRVALIGGLTREAYYRMELVSAIQERLPAWQMVEPAGPPVEGALRLARRLTPALPPRGE